MTEQEQIKCAQCEKPYPRMAPNHAYCSRQCALKAQRKRRDARAKGMKVEAPTAAQRPQISVENQRKLEYWEGQAQAAALNGMDLEQWVKEGRHKSGSEIIRETYPTEEPSATDQALAETGYGTSAMRKAWQDKKELLIKPTDSATPTEEKKHEEGKED